MAGNYLWLRAVWVNGSALVLAFALLTASAGQAATTTFAGRTWQIDNAGKSYSYRNNGDGSVRFEVRKGDVFGNSSWQDPSTSERSELGDTNLPSYSQAWIVDYRMNVEPGPASTSAWLCLFQLKQGPSSTRSPAFEIASRSNRLEVIVRNSSGERVLWRDPEPLKRNFDYNVHIEAYFNTGSSGYARVWINGVRVANYSGPISFPENNAIRARFGIYRRTAPETIAATFSNMSYRLVSPGTTQPPSTTPTPRPSPSPIPTATPLPPTGGLVSIANPGFEDGLTGWENWGNSTSTSDSQAGLRAVAVGINSGGVGQNILSRLVVGKSYRMSVFAKSGSSSDASGRVGMAFRNGTTKLLQVAKSVTSTTYQRYDVDFTVPSGATSAKIFAWKDAGATLLSVDGFSVTEIKTSSNGGISAPVVSGIWTNQSLTPQTGAFTLTFDAIPSASTVDVVIGVSNGQMNGYERYSAMVRFNRSGLIDAGNGTLSGYSAQSSIRYYAGMKYSFRLVIDVARQTYSAYVAPAGEVEVLVLQNAAFRTKTSPLNNLAKAQGLGSVILSNAKILAP